MFNMIGPCPTGLTPPTTHDDGRCVMTLFPRAFWNFIELHNGFAETEHLWFPIYSATYSLKFVKFSYTMYRYLTKQRHQLSASRVANRHS